MLDSYDPRWNEAGTTAVHGTAVSAARAGAANATGTKAATHVSVQRTSTCRART